MYVLKIENLKETIDGWEFSEYQIVSINGISVEFGEIPNDMTRKLRSAIGESFPTLERLLYALYYDLIANEFVSESESDWYDNTCINFDVMVSELSEVARWCLI